MSEPEITTESKERLEVMELDRVPRSEKLARETQLLEGASEVHFTERAFRPRHRATLDEIRAAVDGLAPPPRAELPEPAPLPPPPEPAAAPPRVREEHRAALSPLLHEGDIIVRVESVYKTETGEVVDATIEHHGKEHMGTFLIEDGVARKMADVHHAVDALPAPRVPSPAANTPTTTTPAPPEPEKKGRFAMPKLGKKDKPAPEPKAEPAPADAKPSKFKLPFGKKKD